MGTLFAVIELFGGYFESLHLFTDEESFYRHVVDVVGKNFRIRKTGDLAKDAENIIGKAEAAREEEQDGTLFYFERAAEVKGVRDAQA